VEQKVQHEEEHKPQEESQGSFLSGSGISFLSGLLLLGAGFTLRLDSFGFWNIVIIALALPVVAGFLSFKWKRSGKIAMAKGAMTILVIGCIVAVGVTIWFISVLNRLGN
tara:strand:- start:673 stop:1002 length:330 start_codon:yes stop_codon:yes gene_type:complete